MALIFFNTLGRKQTEFKPINPDTVGIYTCGPTVYNYAHIGNLRPYVFADILGRTLRRRGFATKHIINITDVGHLTSDEDAGEDKVELGAIREGKTAREITELYTQEFFNDLDRLNIDRSNFEFPRATDHIDEQIKLIEKLEAGGFTYKTSDGLYFETSRYPQYSELANLNLAGQEEGARVEVNTEKHQPSDFALWKFSTKVGERQQEWPSPWGVGFPGWHIECSAMSAKYLGPHFDIHTGGIDHISVHHTNERAQSVCANSEELANYWLHVDHMTIDGQKMSKSLGNIYRLADTVSHGHSPLAYRYWLLSSHYRTAINFTWEALAGSETAWLKLISQARDWKNNSSNVDGIVDENYRQKFDEALDRDLNSPQALATVWELAKDEKISPANKLATLLDFDQVLGLKIAEHLVVEKIPEDIELLAQEREKARLAKDWSLADQIRDQISDLGYEVLDTDTGVTLRKKGKI